MNCPKGHPVGAEQETGRTCTEFVCGADPLPVLGGKRQTRRKLKPVDTLLPNDDDEPGEWRDRMKRAKVPAGLGPDQAVDWSQKKLALLLPEAVASLQQDLRYGTPKARSEAATAVMRANGVANKDAVSGYSPTIILQLGDSIKDVPFLQRAEAKLTKGDK